MKLLLDECVVQDFRHLLPDHEVFTVTYLGWSGLKNGHLLEKAAATGFDALITVGRSFAFQHDPMTLPLSVIILHASTNDIDDLDPLVPALVRTLHRLPKRLLLHVYDST